MYFNHLSYPSYFRTYVVHTTECQTCFQPFYWKIFFSNKQNYVCRPLEFIACYKAKLHGSATNGFSKRFEANKHTWNFENILLGAVRVRSIGSVQTISKRLRKQLLKLVQPLKIYFRPRRGPHIASASPKNDIDRSYLPLQQTPPSSHPCFPSRTLPMHSFWFQILFSFQTFSGNLMSFAHTPASCMRTPFTSLKPSRAHVCQNPPFVTPLPLHPHPLPFTLLPRSYTEVALRRPTAAKMQYFI